MRYRVQPGALCQEGRIEHYPVPTPGSFIREMKERRKPVIEVSAVSTEWLRLECNYT